MTPWFEAAGDGPAVLLLHAGIADSRMWERQMGTFALRHRVVRMDLRGFGRSPLPPERFSHVDDVARVLDAVGVERAALVGCSFGAMVATDAALVHADRVSALVLVAAGLRGHEYAPEMERFDDEEAAALEAGDLERAVELNVEFWVDGPQRGQASVDPAVRGLVADMQRRAFELQRDAPDGARADWPAHETKERLAEIAAPTLAVVGELDHRDMHVVAETLAERIPDARSAVIEGTAHLPSLERPDAFDRLVLDFLAGV